MRPHHRLSAVFTFSTNFKILLDRSRVLSIILIVKKEKTNRRETTMTYTDKQMFTALANAETSLLAAIFGEDNVTEVTAKAEKKLATITNRKPAKKDDSKRLANLATFNEVVAPYIAANLRVTAADVRALLGEDVTSSKVGAILKVGVTEGLIERHDIRATDNLAIKCGTYYTEVGYQFPAKTA